jgi:hypothetical protein
MRRWNAMRGWGRLLFWFEWDLWMRWEFEERMAKPALQWTKDKGCDAPVSCGSKASGWIVEAVPTASNSWRTHTSAHGQPSLLETFTVSGTETSDTPCPSQTSHSTARSLPQYLQSTAKRTQHEPVHRHPPPQPSHPLSSHPHNTSSYPLYPLRSLEKGTGSYAP